MVSVRGVAVGIGLRLGGDEVVVGAAVTGVEWPAEPSTHLDDWFDENVTAW